MPSFISRNLGTFIISCLLTQACLVQSQDLKNVINTSGTHKDVVLPFDDRVDFEYSRRGFLGAIETEIQGIYKNRPIWNPSYYDFLAKKAPETVNPSLWRQAQLTAEHGLFEVTTGVYQVRGYDTANMTVIKGDSGWIIIDPLTTREASKASLQLVNTLLGKRPVTAVIYTHNHADHFGGVRGVVAEKDVISGKVPIIAPTGFAEGVYTESILVGNAMARRSSYIFGGMLPRGPKGYVGVGLGATGSGGFGELGLIQPTQYIPKTGEHRVIDGVDIVFQVTHGAEAPAEMLLYLPAVKALCTAEMANHTMHNIYTLRGAKTRDALAWSHYLDEALILFPETEVAFGSHTWPTFGNAEVMDFLEKQRDLYKYIHDQTLRLANHGFVPSEIAEKIQLPKSLAAHWPSRGYYGTLSHNVKGVYEGYFGWYDGNPANLHPLPPVAISQRYVEFMGGIKKIVERASQSHHDGDDRWVATVLNHVLMVQPDYKPARELLASAYDQLGYQSEAGPWRNIYLSAAKELREGVLNLPSPTGLTPDMIRSMPLEKYLDYLSVRVNGPKADGKSYAFNIHLSDTGEDLLITLTNGVLNYRLDVRTPTADASITLPLSLFKDFKLSSESFLAAKGRGEASLQGDEAAFEDFLSGLDQFDFWFNIVTAN
jgi:alkyl sulfatase BDS1-like metallo-beta-lactamase superfamily hydrolase